MVPDRGVPHSAAITQRYLADSVAPGPVYAVEFSPDGTRVATGSGDGSARVFDAASGAEICRLDHDRWVRAVAFITRESSTGACYVLRGRTRDV